MKHPQHILAFDKSAFGELAEGITPIDLREFAICAERSLFIGRRHELEMNPSMGQALPYIVLRQAGKVFAYRRTKLVGEERLAGNTSIGIGGHVDLADIRLRDVSVINIVATFAAAITRELDEELAFIDAAGEWCDYTGLVKKVGPHGMAPKMLGIINDTSNEVGTVHYGILLALDIPDSFTVDTREAELESIGFVDPSELENPESWTSLAAEFIGAQATIA